MDSVLQREGCILRPGASTGQWMIFLVPSAVILSSLRAPEVNNTLLCLSFGILFSSVVQLLNISCRQGQKEILANRIIPGAFTGLILLLCNTGVTVSLLGASLISFAYNFSITTLLRHCPKSFTYGEAEVIVQSLLLFLFSSCINIYKHLHWIPQDEMDRSTLILQVGLIGVISICIGLWLFTFLRSPVYFYIWCFGILGVCVILPLYIIMNTNPVLWIFELLFADVTTVLIVCYWCVCCLTAVAAIAAQIWWDKHASTITRKSFHLLTVAVYIPGLINTYTLLYLASGIIFALLVMLEIVRLLHIPPLYTGLQMGFEMYADEKDVGVGALTPLYLLSGVSLPLWLHPGPVSGQQLPSALLSGLLSVGVGDTTASAVGTWIGTHHWPGSKKTIEGTAASIGSQMLVAIALMRFGYIGGTVISFAKLLFAVVTTSILEANTDQIDNIALPLFMYCILVA